jgi:regulator of protease activity HflC (stomatin/prohibitin superfamily)
MWRFRSRSLLLPVDVGAVLVWKIIAPEKAALTVADYASAISWAAQTALRELVDVSPYFVTDQERMEAITRDHGQ